MAVCRLGIDPTDLSDLSSDSDGDTSRPTSSCLPQEGSSVASGSGVDANDIPVAHTSSNDTVETSAGGSTTHVHVDAVQESSSTSHVEAAVAEAKSSSVGRESTPAITKVCIMSICPCTSSIMSTSIAGRLSLSDLLMLLCTTLCDVCMSLSMILCIVYKTNIHKFCSTVSAIVY